MNENYFRVTLVVLKNFDSASSRFIWEEKKLKQEFQDVFNVLDKVKNEITSHKVRQETVEKILLHLSR
jgi:hypothetical protein